MEEKELKNLGFKAVAYGVRPRQKENLQRTEETKKVPSLVLNVD